MKISGFVTNLGKYNEGEPIGEWITFPIDEDELAEVLERIGVSDKPDENGIYYEEYFFTDWDCDTAISCVSGLGLGEYVSVEYVNEIAEQIDELDEDEQTVLGALIDDGFGFDKSMEIISYNDYIWYDNCNSMEDVAYQIVEETGMLDGVSDFMERYFDYKAYGRDLEIEGTFLEVDNGYIEVIR